MNWGIDFEKNLFTNKTQVNIISYKSYRIVKTFKASNTHLSTK